MTTAQIFHRIDSPFTPAPGTQALAARYALAYTVHVPDADLEAIFAACGNYPGSLDQGWEIAQAQHVDSGRRSLSTGDLVQLPDGSLHAVENTGWRHLPRGIVADGSRQRVRYPTEIQQDVISHLRHNADAARAFCDDELR